MARVPRSERTRNELKDLFSGKGGADRSGLVRQAARLIVEEALESEARRSWGAAITSTERMSAVIAMNIGRAR